MTLSTTHLPSDRTSINVQGVITLRWVAVLGQLLTVVAVRYLMQVNLPLGPLLTIQASIAAINVALINVVRQRPADDSVQGRKLWRLLLGGTMLFDLLALTAQLYFTGGITNPFSMFFFVNLVLSAMVLPGIWVWSLNVLSIGCVTFLMFNYQPLHVFQDVTWEKLAGLNSSGMLKLGALIAYSTCSTVIVSFTNRISDQLGRQEQRARQLTELRNRSERLEALGTLAAGAAHELSTPLSSIAIIIKEVEHDLETRNLPSQTFEDIRTIRSQLDRCRDILDRMSADAGDAISDNIVDTTVDELVQQSVRSSLLTMTTAHQEPPAVTFHQDVNQMEIQAPLHGLAQAIRAILQNAIDASAQGGRIECDVRPTGDRFEILIRDSGDGMDEETLRRIGEPFFTTKEAGRGTGLGIFLARNVIERLGGTLAFASEIHVGTSATIQLPRIARSGESETQSRDSAVFSFPGTSVRLGLRRKKSQRDVE